MEGDNRASEWAKQTCYERLVSCGAISLVFPSSEDLARSIDVEDGQVESLADITPYSNQREAFHTVNLEAVRSSERDETDVYGLVKFDMPPNAPKASNEALTRMLLGHFESQIAYLTDDIHFNGEQLTIHDTETGAEVDLECIVNASGQVYINLRAAISPDLTVEGISRQLQATACAWAQAYDFALRLRTRDRPLAMDDYLLVPVGSTKGAQIHDIELLLAMELHQQQMRSPAATLPNLRGNLDTKYLHELLELQMNHEDLLRIAKTVIFTKRRKHLMSSSSSLSVDTEDIATAAQRYAGTDDIL